LIGHSADFLALSGLSLAQEDWWPLLAMNKNLPFRLSSKPHGNLSVTHSCVFSQDIGCDV
jgi:hypothetical protein